MNKKELKKRIMSAWKYLEKHRNDKVITDEFMDCVRLIQNTPYWEYGVSFKQREKPSSAWEFKYIGEDK